MQFLTESILLAAIGGMVGLLAGIVATAIYASTKGWAVVIRRGRGPDAGRTSVSAAADRGVADGMNHRGR